MSKRMAMGRVWWLVSLVAALGCLEAGGAGPPGREIVAGRKGRRPTLVRAGEGLEGLFVVYETLKSDGEPQMESPRLWAIPYLGGQVRQLAENGAWPVTREQAGTILVLHDVDPAAAQPPVRWYPRTSAALSRIDLRSGQAVTEFPSILDFGFWQGRLFLETSARPKALRQIEVEHDGGELEPLAPAADVKWSGRGDMFLLVPNPDPAARTRGGALMRIRAPGQDPSMLATGVTQFILHPSGDWLLGRSHASNGDDELWLLDLINDRRSAVDLAPDCAWLGFVPSTRRLVCVRPAAATKGLAELHVVDLDRGGDQTWPMASGDARALELVWSNDGTAGLLRERGHAWLLRPNGSPGLQPLGHLAYHPAFSPDGHLVAYIDLEPGPDSDGHERLVVQDTELAAPPRPLTPPGAFLHSYFFTDDGGSVLDVSHSGDYRASLNLTELATGERRRLAGGLGWSIWPWNHGSVMVEPQVIASGNRVLLVDNWSEQDRVGDLRLLDLGTHTDEVLAHAVAGFTVAPPCSTCNPLAPGAALVIAVYERLASDQDGFWALTLP